MLSLFVINHCAHLNWPKRNRKPFFSHIQDEVISRIFKLGIELLQVRIIFFNDQENNAAKCRTAPSKLYGPNRKSTIPLKNRNFIIIGKFSSI